MQNFEKKNYINNKNIMEQDCIEIKVTWSDTVINSWHVILDHQKEGQSIFSIGEKPDCNVKIPVEYLDGRDCFNLIDFVNGDVLINILPGMNISSYPSNEDTVIIFSRGQEIISPTQLILSEGNTLKIQLNGIEFIIKKTKIEKLKLPKITTVQDYNIFCFAAAFLGHIIALTLVFFVPQDPSVLSLDRDDYTGRFTRYLIEPPELQNEQLPTWFAKEAPDDNNINFSKRASGDPGKMGDPNSPQTNHRFGIKGQANQPPVPARETQRQYALNSGILKMLNSSSVTSPFGAEFAIGNDPENALGQFIGDDIGQNFGYLGLAVNGTGRGGGNPDNTNTIGVGDLRNIYLGSISSGTHLKNIKRDINRNKVDISVKGEVKSLTGTLPQDVIRRYIRQNFNKIRFCYERRLISRPDLAGRVTVRFIISADGTVTSSLVVTNETTINDFEVENCVKGVFSTIVFPPPPDSGVVIVSYPVLFQYSDN